MNTGFVTATKAAKALGISKSEVFDLVAIGRLTAVMHCSWCRSDEDAARTGYWTVGPNELTHLKHHPGETYKFSGQDKNGAEVSIIYRGTLDDVRIDAASLAALAPAAKPREQGRRDRLTVAIEAALSALRKNGMPSPTAGDVFDYLAENDETGIVVDSTEKKLTWQTSEEHLKDTSRKALANRLTGLRKKTPA